MWLLHPTRAAQLTLGVVSLILLGVVVLSPRASWQRWHPRAALTFPLCVLAGLGSIGVADNGAAFAYSALTVFCFVYLGLTQPPLSSLILAPPAALSWLATVTDRSSTTSMIRLAIAITIWVAVGELLAQRAGFEDHGRQVLEGEAQTDVLTGLLNRRGLENWLTRTDHRDTVVMCDLDHFKTVNDLDGHGAGDQVLARFGELLQAALRGQDVAARYGGEEFVLLLIDTSPEAALDVLARMRDRWAATYPGITFSAGIAAVSTTIANAITAADGALYESKANGRNCDHIAYQHIVRASR
jgi:diguanylate cyclase (GGDEF)-like protein